MMVVKPIKPPYRGTTGDEVISLADCVIDEFTAWKAEKPLQYQVTREVLETMG
jgi:hypothetical protein